MNSAWKPELEKLRKIILGCPLREEVKWDIPVYTFNGKKVVGLHGFREHFAVWFYNGVFLGDPHHLLISQAGKKNTRITSAKPSRLQHVKKEWKNTAHISCFIPWKI
jgi:uncharacterized protein YdeI (YjbR/CyaY-like superfamily)